MTQMIEISTVTPKKMKILIPQRLFEELEHSIRGENLSAIITEALANELKKIRFRIDLEKSLRQAGLKQDRPSE